MALQPFPMPGPATLAPFSTHSSQLDTPVPSQPLCYQSHPHAFRHLWGCVSVFTSDFELSALNRSSRKCPHQYHSKCFSFPLFSYSYALFCTAQNAIFNLFISLRTLCTNHPGWGALHSHPLPPNILSSLSASHFLQQAYTRASGVYRIASDFAYWRHFMSKPPRGKFALYCVLAALLVALPHSGRAQEPAGPQTAAPPPQPEKQPAARTAPASTDKIRIPAGTRVAVVLENGISTRGAKAGDSVYFHTSFPITQNNHIIIPVGSYLRGELIESKRPGRVKGRGEFRMRLDTLIFPSGYTVDLNAAPRSADSGGKETMDSEGKVISPGGKGKDAQTVAETTATGAGIGAIRSEE